MAVPYTFGSATSAIPLSQLDSNFSTAITLGNTAIQLGNTVTTLNNMTLANVTISSGSTTLTNETISGNLTLSGGTANGVVYLNTSKVATSGTAFVFDGTNLGIGTSSPASALYVKRTAGNAGVYADYNGTNIGRLEAASNGNLYIGTTTGTGSVLLGTTANAAALELNNSGNLGLGVTPSFGSGSKALQVGPGASMFSGSATQTIIGNNWYNNSGDKFIGTGYAALYQQSNGQHLFQTSNASGTAGNAITFTQAMTLDASGNLLVGTTSAFGKFKVNVGTNQNLFVTTNNSMTSLGSVNDASSGYTDIEIRASQQIFHNGSAERARIDSSGSLLVGTTTGTTSYDMKMYVSSDSGTNKWAVGPRVALPGTFYVAANTTYGVYLSSTTATSWSSASDERVKTDLQPIENAAEKVCSLRAVTGRYISDDSGVRKPFLIAQDVLAVLPEAVDTTDPEKYGLAYTDTIPLLVAAIKEQQAIIEQLKADVAALKGKA